MGRLTGVPHFFSEEAHREEKGDAMNLRKARKEQVVDDDSDNENGNERDDDDPMKLCQYSIAQRMQGQFQGRVIRRTVESKDWQGQSLLKIPPYKSVHAILDLTERETALIAAKAEEVKDSLVCSFCPLFCKTLSLILGCHPPIAPPNLQPGVSISNIDYPSGML